MGGNVVGNELKFLKKILIKSDFYQKFSFLRGDQGYHTGTSTLPGKTKLAFLIFISNSNFERKSIFLSKN